jgi:pilus assembly protein CpaD
MASRNRSAGLGGRACAGLLAVLLVGGCSHSMLEEEVHFEVESPQTRHPITIVDDRAVLDVVLSPSSRHGLGIANLEVIRFARRYHDEGKGPFVITVPPHIERRHRAAARLRDVQDVLAKEGISAGRIRVDKGPAPRAGAITLSYRRVAAVGPTCGDWSEDASKVRGSMPYRNFGCASQRNLAHMVANPIDLSVPARETPRGSDRRAIPHKAYSEAPAAPVKLDAR